MFGNIAIDRALIDMKLHIKWLFDSIFVCYPSIGYITSLDRIKTGMLPDVTVREPSGIGLTAIIVAP